MTLNYHQKNVACQVLEPSIPLTEKINSIKTLYYRSLFQIYLKEIDHDAWKNPQNYHISKIKPQYTENFNKYFHYCTNILNIKCPSDDNINKLEELNPFKQFAIFYSLRNSYLFLIIKKNLNINTLTDVFESLIIEDRIEYLKSFSLSVKALPIFPVNKSPRNIVIISKF